jgi:hypothetical protein
MTTNLTPVQNAAGSFAGQPHAANGLALVRLIIGAMLVSVFFENLVSEWGTSWIWELLVPVVASLGLVVGHAGRAWGIDALLARRHASSPWW